MDEEWVKIPVVTGDGSYQLLQFDDGETVAQIDKIAKDSWELKIEYKRIILTTRNKTRKRLESEAEKLIELLRSYN